MSRESEECLSGGQLRRVRSERDRIRIDSGDGLSSENLAPRLTMPRRSPRIAPTNCSPALAPAAGVQHDGATNKARSPGEVLQPRRSQRSSTSAQALSSTSKRTRSAGVGILQSDARSRIASDIDMISPSPPRSSRKRNGSKTESTKPGIAAVMPASIPTAQHSAGNPVRHSPRLSQVNAKQSVTPNNHRPKENREPVPRGTFTVSPRAKSVRKVVATSMTPEEQTSAKPGIPLASKANCAENAGHPSASGIKSDMMELKIEAVHGFAGLLPNVGAQDDSEMQELASQTLHKKQSVSEPDGPKQTVSDHNVPKQSASEPDGLKHSVSEPDGLKQSVSEPDGLKQSVSEPDGLKQSVSEPGGPKQSVNEADGPKPSVSESEGPNSKHNSQQPMEPDIVGINGVNNQVVIHNVQEPEGAVDPGLQHRTPKRGREETSANAASVAKPPKIPRMSASKTKGPSTSPIQGADNDIKKDGGKKGRRRSSFVRGRISQIPPLPDEDAHSKSIVSDEEHADPELLLCQEALQVALCTVKSENPDLARFHEFEIEACDDIKARLSKENEAEDQCSLSPVEQDIVDCKAYIEGLKAESQAWDELLAQKTEDAKEAERLAKQTDQARMTQPRGQLSIDIQARLDSLPDYTKLLTNIKQAGEQAALMVDQFKKLSRSLLSFKVAADTYIKEQAQRLGEKAFQGMEDCHDPKSIITNFLNLRHEDEETK